VHRLELSMTARVRADRSFHERFERTLGEPVHRRQGFVSVYYEPTVAGWPRDVRLCVQDRVGQPDGYASLSVKRRLRSASPEMLREEVVSMVEVVAEPGPTDLFTLGPAVQSMLARWGAAATVVHRQLRSKWQVPVAGLALEVSCDSGRWQPLSEPDAAVDTASIGIEANLPYDGGHDELERAGREVRRLAARLELAEVLAGPTVDKYEEYSCRR